MKNLKISISKHRRIKQAAAKEGVSIMIFTDAIFEDALKKLQQGEASFEQPNFSSRPVPQDEAAQEGEK
jgi:hypothetical protein